MVEDIETLKAKIQAKGFKVEHYESPMQFNILIQAKNGDHCFARIFTGGNLKNRFAIKNEACLKMQELINQN